MFYPRLPHRLIHAFEAVEPRRLLASIPAGFTSEPWGGRMDEVSELAFAPDGRMFAATQPGGLYIVNADGTPSGTGPALQLNVAHEAEQGLSGIAFDPNFASNGWVYLYYTNTLNATTFQNEIGRFTVTKNNTIDPASKQVIMDMDPVVNAIHNAGAMAFGADGKLYVAIGDGAVSTNAQSVNNRQGKVLRINADGSIPTDNPTTFIVHPAGGVATTVTTSGVYRSIYALGLRNPFSMDFDDATGQLIVGDVGQDTWEELNVIKPGGNYGWPTTYDGDFSQPDYPEFTRPIYTFAHGTTLTTGNAIIGVSYYGGLTNNAANAFPSQYNGKIFFGNYSGDGWIDYIDPAAPPAANNASVFATGFAGMTDMEVGPDGSLYVVQRWTNNPGVLRIKPNTAVAPAIVQQPQNQTAAVGEAVNFNVGVTGQAPLTYQWYRNGNAITGATGATYTLASAALADSGASFYVVATNSIGQVQSGTVSLTVSTNAAPVPTIISPDITVLATGGVQINLLGSGTDAEDGTLAGTSLTWVVDYYTGGVQRPFVSAFTGTSGSFTPYSVTPYLKTDVFYRISLTATDSGGRSTTVTRDVQPLITTTTLATNFSGLPLILNGVQVTSPYTFQGMAGVQQQLEAPATSTLNGLTYTFTGWSNGGSILQTFTTPSTSSTITATYAPPAPLQVSSVVVDTSAAPKAIVTFSGKVLNSVDLYDFVLSSPTNPWISLPSQSIVFDTVNNRATIQLASSALAAGSYTFTVYAAGITDDFGNPIAANVATAFTSAPVITSAALSGRVFADANNDGVVQTGETGLAGVKVWIDANTNGVLDTGETATTTSSTGDYQFAGLAAGSYTVRAAAPVGYVQSTIVTAVTISAGQTVAVAPPIGFYQPPVTATSMIAGVVFNDLDQDGWHDTNEAGRAGVVVYSDTNNNGVFDTGEANTSTDSGGYYELRNLAVGTYNIRAVRGTLIQTSPAGNGAVVMSVTAANQSLFAKDIGLATPAALPLPTPTALVATAPANYQVHLTWASDQTNVTSFVIERRIGTGAWVLISDVVTRVSRSYDDWSVGRAVTYTYRVRTKGASGTSDPSNEITIKSK